ncbi:hypothetical protein LEP1GSC036_4083 [Leptospira weilii str. 2006001853]|uniref:Uncharacterized protein n=1 Tax=Leptospira weilii str. 2006001853 TaxID=1001589 RepID=A0A828Z5I4_9LEPT|nr:hypothetical protein LEP1GSC036_4083 [Leptospira weilii str. 2006001853]
MTSTFTIFLPFLSKIDFASRFVKKQIDTKDKTYNNIPLSLGSDAFAERSVILQILSMEK